jgi:hypothetical protein
VQLTERTSFRRQTSQSNLKIDTDHVGAGKSQNITRDVALAGSAKSSDVSNTSGVAALDGSVAQLAGDRRGVRLSGHGSGQHSDGGNNLENGGHDETCRRRIGCRECEWRMRV